MQPPLQGTVKKYLGAAVCSPEQPFATSPKVEVYIRRLPFLIQTINSQVNHPPQ